jgi:hypothetical protein
VIEGWQALKATGRRIAELLSQLLGDPGAQPWQGIAELLSGRDGGESSDSIDHASRARSHPGALPGRPHCGTTIGAPGCSCVASLLGDPGAQPWQAALRNYYRGAGMFLRRFAPRRSRRTAVAGRIAELLSGRRDVPASLRSSEIPAHSPGRPHCGTTIGAPGWSCGGFAPSLVSARILRIASHHASRAPRLGSHPGALSGDCGTTTGMFLRRFLGDPGAQPWQAALRNYYRGAGMFLRRFAPRRSRRTALAGRIAELLSGAGMFLRRFAPRRSRRTALAGRIAELLSGRRDSNPGPSAPKADALPDCATPRQMDLVMAWESDGLPPLLQQPQEKVLPGRPPRYPLPFPPPSIRSFSPEAGPQTRREVSHSLHGHRVRRLSNA